MTDDYTLTISKDGVVRLSTGETFTLNYPTDAAGEPDFSNDYYFVEEGLPAGFSDNNFDLYSNNSQLWEAYYDENFLSSGKMWVVIYTRDGSVPDGFRQ